MHPKEKLKSAKKAFRNHKNSKAMAYIQKVAFGNTKLELAAQEIVQKALSKIEEKSKALAESAQKFGEKVYASQQNQSGQNQQADSADANSEKTVDGDVVDAEFEEVNEEKKEEDK